MITKSLSCLMAVWGLFFFASCGASPEPHPLPEAPVRLTLDLSGDAYVLREPLATFEVRTPRTLNEYVGIGGIVVVHGISQGSVPKYYAYDMACPVEAPDVSVIGPYSGNEHEGLILYHCPSCGSVYELALGIGNPISGPGSHPLRQYMTTFHPNDVLSVSDQR